MIKNSDEQQSSFIGSFSFFRFLGDLNRLRQIVSVLFDAGFSEIMSRMKVIWAVSLVCRIHCWFSRGKCPQEDLPKRLRVAFETLGPSFMKLGQVLSMRPDLVPEAYIKELSKLQDKAPVFSYETVKKIIEDELKKPIKDIFVEFYEEPIASASLGQVHRAILQDGTTVAVKVQRPDITKLLQKDMRIIAYLIQKMEQYLPDVRRLRPRDALDAFTRSLARELDYTVEGRNADRFRYNFRDEKGITTPKIFWDYTTSRVLTMEFVVGTKMGDFYKLDKQGLNHEEVMKNCTRGCLLPVFRDGFFHADPHPGNVWALKDNSVCWLDFGMVGSVPKKLRLNMLLFTLFIINRDIESGLYYLLEMAEISDDSDVEGYSEEVTAIIISLYARTDTTQTISQSFFIMIRKASEYRIYFPAGLIMLAKALMTGETMCRLSHKNYDILETARPLFKEVYQKEFGVSTILTQFQKFLPDLMMFLQKMPELARTQISKATDTSTNPHAVHH